MNTTPLLEQVVQEPVSAPANLLENEWMPPAEGKTEEPSSVSEEKQELSPEISAPVPEQKRDAYWRTVLTGSPDTIPDAVRQRVLPEEQEKRFAMTEQERNYELCGNINRSWLVDHSSHSRAQVGENWHAMRAELARDLGVNSDEQEVFVALSEKAYEDEIKKKAQRVYEDSYKAALLGSTPAALPEESEEEKSAAWEAVAEQARSKAEAEREELLPLANQVASAWDALKAPEDTLFPWFRIFGNAPDLVMAIEELNTMPKEKRARVYGLAQELARERGLESQPVGTLEAMQRSVRRGVATLRQDLLQGAGYVAASSLDSFGAYWDLDSFRYVASEMDSRLQMFRELRDVAQGKVFPISLEEDAGLVSQLAVDVAAGTPPAILAFSGLGGFGVLTTAGIGESVAEARKRTPEGEMVMQTSAAMLGAALQSGIYMGLGDVGRRLVGNSIASFMKAKGQGIKGYSLASLQTGKRFLEANAKMLLAGKAAQAASLGSQELAAQLEGLESHIDWKLYGDNLLDIETNMREAAMNLPFILIAAGRASLHHFRAPSIMMSDTAFLESWGVDASLRERIHAEPDMRKKNDMLREAFRSSKRWSGAGFFADIMRAMNLLNTKEYQGFKEEANVREFLQLPAELPSRLNQIEKRDMQLPEVQKEALARLAPSKVGKQLSPRTLEALQMMDLWYQKANLWKQQLSDPARARVSYLSEIRRQGNLVPMRLKYDGFYRPHVEKERRQYLADAVDELNSLSYNCLLLTHSLDGLTYSYNSRAMAEKNTEKVRRRLLSHIFQAVMLEECGVPTEEAFRPFNDYFYRLIRESKRNYNAPDWLKKSNVGGQWFKLAHTMPMEKLESAHFAQQQHRFVQWLKSKSWKHYHNRKPYAVVHEQKQFFEQPETLECFRIITGLHAKAERIREILPYMEDYQTALTRGMSPLQASAYLIQREFGDMLIPEIWQSEAELSKQPDAAEMEKFTAENKALYEQYRSFTGRSLESTQLEDGKQLWRLQRPDGKHTRWHDSPEAAMNDMVANSLNSFRSLWLTKKKILANERLSPQGMDGEPQENSMQVYTTAHDLLGGVAARELTRFWLEDSTRTPAGLDYILSPQGYNWKHLTEPRMFSGERDVRSFWYSARATPYSMMRKHFADFWKTVLQAERVDGDQLMEFLSHRGVLRPSIRQRLDVLAHGRKRNLRWYPGPVRREFLKNELGPDIQPDIPLFQHKISQHMADYTMRYFLSNMESLPMPDSVREWFSLVPLCPPEVPERRVFHGAWRFLSLGARSNIASVKRLQKMSALVPEYREKLMAEDEKSFIGELLREAVGNSTPQRLEQGWCFALSGIGALRSREHASWKFLREPSRQWNTLLPETQQALRDSLAQDLARFNAPEEAASPTLEAALANLQTVLEEYPELRNYMLTPGSAEKLLRMQLNEAEVQGLFPLPKTRSELFYDKPVRPVKNGFELFPEGDLPEPMQADTRVKPALRLLSHLRQQLTNMPYADDLGIWWQGKRYGGHHGERPPGVGGEWIPQPLLYQFRKYLERLDAEARQDNPDGVLDVCGVKLRGLTPDMLDSSVLEYGTVYNNRSMPKFQLRLMPGAPYAAHPYLRAPYVVHSTNGGLLLPKTILRKMEERHLAYQPLHTFNSVLNRQYEDYSTLRPGRINVLELLNEVVHRRAVSMNHLEVSRNEPLSNVEIIMQLAQDNRLSDYVAQMNPREMTRGEALSVGLLRNLVEYEFGRDKRRAARELVELCRKLRRSSNDMNLLQRTFLRVRSQESYMPEGNEAAPYDTTKD